MKTKTHDAATVNTAAKFGSIHEKEASSNIVFLWKCTVSAQVLLGFLRRRHGAPEGMETKSQGRIQRGPVASVPAPRRPQPTQAQKETRGTLEEGRRGAKSRTVRATPSCTAPRCQLRVICVSQGLSRDLGCEDALQAPQCLPFHVPPLHAPRDCTAGLAAPCLTRAWGRPQACAPGPRPLSYSQWHCWVGRRREKQGAGMDSGRSPFASLVSSPVHPISQHNTRLSPPLLGALGS